MRVSIDNTTGLIIETQSHAREGTLISNALSAGFTDVSELEVTEQELADLIKAKELATETAEQTIKRLEKVLDDKIDAVAREHRYESIRTMVTYATSDHPQFGPEGRAAVKFRDAVYAYGIQVIADVQAGLRPIPTEEELLAGVPLITDYFQ